MVDWNTYDELLTIWGKTARERDVERGRSDFVRYASESPAYQMTTVSGNDVGMLVHSTKDLSTKTFDAAFDSGVMLGDIVVINHIHWLVTEIGTLDEITLRGKIEQCNRLISWQNPNTLNIVSRWCIATKPYYSNITDTKYIDTSSREFKIRVSYDSETSLVDIDKRFLMEVINGEPKSYKCTSVDMVTDVYADLGKGFISWNLEQDQYNPSTDNAEIMIADYVSTTSDIGGGETDGLSIVGRDVIYIGTSQTYSVNGAADVVWNVVSPTPDVTYRIEHGSLVLSVASTVSSIGRKIVLCATDVTDTSRTQTKEVRVVSLF